jgi:hypothetical protein
MEKTREDKASKEATIVRTIVVPLMSAGSSSENVIPYYSKEDQPFISNIIIVPVRLALLLRAISNLLLL